MIETRVPWCWKAILLLSTATCSAAGLQVAAPAQDDPAAKSGQHVNESVTAAQMQHSAAQANGVAAQMPVARLSRRAGAVSIGSKESVEPPVDAALNMPLVAGSRIATGGDGEAEVEFADGSVLRLTPDSAAEIVRLDPASHQSSILLENGLFYLELRASSTDSFAVAAAELLLTPEENSSFRLRVQGEEVETAVLLGSISVTRPNAYTAQVSAGESLRTDPKNSRRYLLADTAGPESWDAWNERLSQAAQDQQAARTTARDGYAGDQGYGWSDLDAQGRWYTVAGEGELWQPTLADAGFDPYGLGSWVYGPGGYTWASGYGWGWLPYRCGTWSYFSGFGWGWMPSSGCLSFGFGGYGGDGGYGGGGFRVRQPPAGWRPPPRPGIGGPQRHPTLPVQLRAVQMPADAPVRRGNEPVRIGGAVAVPLPRVGRQRTPQGGSAVGSALLRDFPFSAGTHEPALGMQPHGAVVLPGRPTVWQGMRSAREASAGNGGLPDVRRAVDGTVPGAFGGTRVKGSTSSATQGFATGQPLPTDPPLGAAGAPPLGANGQPPTGDNGPAPFGGIRGEALLRHGASGTAQENATRDLRGPLQTHGGEGLVRSGAGLPVSRPALSPAPVPVPRVAGPAPQPRVSAPAPAAPHAAPAPAASAVRSK